MNVGAESPADAGISNVTRSRLFQPFTWADGSKTSDYLPKPITGGVLIKIPRRQPA